MLEAKNISINYGARTAVRNVSLRVEPAKVIAILGPNGAGKSTLLRALNGSVTPTSGEVTLDEKPLRTFARRLLARHIGVVAQEAVLSFPVTVFEFVLGGRYAWANVSAWGWESERDLEIAQRALRETELDGFETRLMNELSGGERQRAVLARALATEAKTLLLDEPTANLDLAHQAMMFRLVRERCRNAGVAAIVITHDLNLAAEFADRILVLKVGKVFALHEPESVLTSENITSVFGVNVLLDENRVSRNIRVTTLF